MTDVMQTALGRKWWFAGLLAGLSAFLTLPLLRAAGIDSPEGWAQWLVCMLCFYCIWRWLGALIWFAVVLLAPRSKLLDPARR